MISDEQTTRISFIESVLNVKYEGSSIADVGEFINKHFINARKNEPTFKDYLHRKREVKR